MTETKTCTKCHEAKSLSEYTRNRTKGSPDGLRPYCRQCQAKQRKDYRERNSDSYCYRNRTKYRDTETRGIAAWHKANPEASAAHRAVHKAVKKQILRSVKECSCAYCQAAASHYHHYLGYQQLHWLDVIPLCRSCHRGLHKKSY